MFGCRPRGVLVLTVILIGCLATAARADPTFVLTWLVRPSVASKDPSVDYPLTPVELMAGKERIVLKPEMGMLMPFRQSVCAGKLDPAFPLEKDEVAKIAFFEGGTTGYFVRRLTATSLGLYSWGQTDGACPDGKGDVTVCPRSEKKLRTIAVRAGAKIVQQLRMVDARGKETPFVCKD